MNLDLGSRVRALRKSQHVTLSALAEQTGLSLGYLSKLENDLTSPTIAHLHKICEALGLTINDILAEPEEHTSVVVVHRAERKPLFQQNRGGLQFEALTKGHTILQASAMTIQDDTTYDSQPHTHDELGIVSEGEMELLAGGCTYRLAAGDSVYIHAGTMHSCRKRSAEPCVSYWIKVAAAAEK